jgi:hypothetical protein
MLRSSIWPGIGADQESVDRAARRGIGTSAEPGVRDSPDVVRGAGRIVCSRRRGERRRQAGSEGASMGPCDASRQVARPAGALRSAVLCLALAVAAGCAAAQPATGGRTAPPDFPVGAYAKEFQDPFLGRMQIDWVFDPSGRWAEIPIALDNQAIGASVVRGRFTVEGDTVTIAADYPPGIGTSRHEWRLDGDHLWTTFESSTNEDDAAWFALLDPTPWTLLP